MPEPGIGIGLQNTAEALQILARPFTPPVR